MSVDELGKTIGGAIQDKEDMKNQLIKPGDFRTRFLLGTYKMRLREIKCVVESQTVPTAGFVLDHPTYGLLDSSTLDGTFGSWTVSETITSTQVHTTVGRTEVAKWIGSESAEHAQYMAWGTSSTAYNEEQTAMSAEVGDRKSPTVTTVTQDEVVFAAEVKSVDGPIGLTLKEVGLLGQDNYHWNLVSEFDDGVSDPNITISNGDIRIG